MTFQNKPKWRGSKPMTPAEFGRLRKQLGLTQVALGERLGRSSVQVSRYECGLALIPLVVAEAIRGLAVRGAA